MGVYCKHKQHPLAYSGGDIMRPIYGVSSKYDFGRWDHVVYVFENREIAEKWLYTEEYDFRERELMSKTAAIQLAGKEAVENANIWKGVSDECYM